MATLVKRGAGQWQVKVRRKGYSTESKTFATKALAEQWSRQVESQMDVGVFVSTSIAETTLLSELFGRYLVEVAPQKKSAADIECRLRLLGKHLGHLMLASLTPMVVKEYRDFRLQRVCGETVRKELLMLGRVLKLAQREWEIYLPKGNAVASISLPQKSKPRERRLEDGEEQRLMLAARNYGGMISCIIEFAIATGARRGEIVALDWANIDLQKRVATFKDTKNGDCRAIPLSVTALEVLRRNPRHIVGRVFPIRPDGVTKAFTRVCKSASILNLNFHDLRHEATSRFFEMGLSVMEVASITGHHDLSMLNRYTHLRAEDLAIKLSQLRTEGHSQ